MTGNSILLFNFCFLLEMGPRILKTSSVGDPVAVAPKENLGLSLVPGSVTELTCNLLWMRWPSETPAPLCATWGEGFLLGLLDTVPGVELPELQLSRALKSVFSAPFISELKQGLACNKAEGRPEQSNLFVLTGDDNVFLTSALVKSGVIDVTALFYLCAFSVAVFEWKLRSTSSTSANKIICLYRATGSQQLLLSHNILYQTLWKISGD